MTFQRLPQVPPMELPEELKETFALLEAQGWNPRLCDTPVPYFDAGIPCGSPRDVYEATPDGYILVPRSLVGNDATVIARVTGDSMRDAGIEHDDQLHILLDAPVHDGDVVVACIDGECTVKSYYKDADGTVWLVPRNDDYHPIRITEDMNAHIVGKVISHRKPAPRTSFSYMQRAVERTLAERAEAAATVIHTTDEVRNMLLEACVGTMTVSADWIAVYRILVDKCGAPTSFKAFAEYVNDLALDELPPCTADSLRKADPVYLRPLFEWTPEVAPKVRISILDKRLSMARALRKMLA